MAKILLVDDDQGIRRTLRDILEFEGYEIEESPDGLDCVTKLKKKDYDAVIMDVKMPRLDGMDALERIQFLKPEIPVIMISGHGNIDTAVDSVKKGAFDFIQKPPDLNRLLITIRNAMDKSKLIIENKTLEKKVSKAKTNPEIQKIIGKSDSIKLVNETIERVAPTEARVLVNGKNGTGKELVARWMHAKSQRADKPLVEVNCAAIPSELIESELFGHEKGSFTSAHKKRVGKFELADGGTLFLDEVGDMSLSAQAKVLRALQENTISRVGGEKAIKVDVRIIAATNRDLRSLINVGKFREDLYHRLAVIIVDVPSLNDRREDIPLLVHHFIKQICDEYNIPEKRIAKVALKGLMDINWTGNIRELRNVVERLIILSGEIISNKDVQNFVNPSAANNTKMEDFMAQFETLEELQAYVAREYHMLNTLTLNR